MKDTKWTLVCELICEQMTKCESGQNMWKWTDVEDETSTSETGKQGNREHVWYVQRIYVDGTMYSTCKWDRIVRTVVQYVLWCHKTSKRLSRHHRMASSRR